MRPARTAAAARGFTLIEALIALALVSVGMLALIGLHVGLAKHADLARQRTEASLLAQSRIEELRAFEQLAAAPGRASYATLASGQDLPAIASNTRYERRWIVDGGPGDRERRIELQVDWLDRSGDRASVRLLTLIARNEPADGGWLGMAPSSDDRRIRPRERALDIPPEATPLRGRNRGRSVLPWPGATVGFLVFDDATGAVTAGCSAAPRDDTDIGARCTPLQAYLLRGHLRGDWIADVYDLAVVDTQHVLAVPECFVGDLFDDAGGTAARMRSYRCLVRAADHDLDPSTPRAWSGRAIVLPPPEAGQSVCRDTPDPATTDNDLHPAAYTLVTGPLQHQNFLLLAAGPCPARTALHQP